MTTEELTQKLEKIIQENLPEAFLVSCKVIQSARNVVQIYVDTDAGITLKECSVLSRAIGKYFDEADLFDFPYEMELSSPGIDNPLILTRQYVKNIGRYLSVTLLDGTKLIGILKNFENETIYLEIEVPSPEKKIKKILQMQEIPLNTVKEAMVQVQPKQSKKSK